MMGLSDGPKLKLAEPLDVVYIHEWASLTPANQGGFAQNHLPQEVAAFTTEGSRCHGNVGF
jgi:hypothetical protein